MKDNYPTRNNNAHSIIKRLEPVAWRNWYKGAPISQADYSSWCSDGYMLIDGLFSAGYVDQLAEASRKLQTDPALAGREEAITENGSNDLRSLFRPQDFSEVIRAVAHHPRLLAIAEFLLDSQVYLHQSRINFKPAFRGKDFWWHSDFETWHAEDGLPSMRAVSISISLTENTANNGPLLLVPGSQKYFISCPGDTPDENFRSSLREQQLGTPDEICLKTLVTRGIDAATGPAGTVTIFDCNTLHGSGSNITPWPRSNLFFVYNSVENLPVDPFCGQKPRPSFVAERNHFSPMKSII